ncbi:family membrane protein [Legionella massiliensis]|uniref:Family membrane protein n=1 Tax=Legionella massiliensis TaxID=1034943 RepID=A0A078L114_9GAMM|nr:FUSC family protein [Legionella massiliensis]CDZ77739.1 family membrane protein [Legionella massiliensis]CEE13477.1 hypothetical protein BN1094_02029 [Legionella massiliensis]
MSPLKVNWLKNEVRWNFLLRGIFVLMPMACLFLLTKNAYWLQVSVLTMSTLIVEEKLRLSLLGVLLHGAGIILLFNLLFLTEETPLVFILICTTAATAIIWIASQGEQLRTLGNWTFIPAIILSIELASEMKYELQKGSVHPYLLAALIPTLLVSIYEQIRAYRRGEQFVWLSYLSDFGKRESNIESMIAMGLGIIVAASLVEYLPMENGQWMIWGVASVITGNVETSPKKFHQRLIGVVIGVPAGIGFGLCCIPSNPYTLTLVTVSLFLTLVAFRRYVIAYTFRCFFVATAVILVTHSSAIALERLSHVIAGGLIGLLCVIFSPFLLKGLRTIRLRI